MNKDNFDITLLNFNKEFILSYKWYFVPNIGDTLSLSNDSLFLVKERLLPTTDSNCVVLIGELK